MINIEVQLRHQDENAMQHFFLFFLFSFSSFVHEATVEEFFKMNCQYLSKKGEVCADEVRASLSTFSEHRAESQTASLMWHANLRLAPSNKTASCIA